MYYSLNKQECDCKETENNEKVEEWLLDSGTSMHFTLYLSDFSSFEELKPEKIQTAAKNHVLEAVLYTPPPSPSGLCLDTRTVLGLSELSK